MADLKCCPICGRSKTDEDIRGAERDWEPSFYDPDSGGDPLYIHCECGLEFSTGTYDYPEFVNAWNTRKPMEAVVAELEEKRLTSQSARMEASIGMCGESVNYYSGEMGAFEDAISIVRGKE